MSFDPNSLQAQIRQGVIDFLKDPTQLPDEFKSWLPRWAEVNPPATQLQDIQNLYTMQSTVSGMGAAINGRIGMIRCGSSPYEYQRVTYDAVLGKWLGDASLAAGPAQQHSTTHTSFFPVPLFGEASINTIIVNALDLYNAGLRPQFSWYATVDASADGITVKARPAIYEFNATDNPMISGTLLAHTTGISYVRTGGATSQASQTWEDMTWDATPTKPNWIFLWQMQTSSGTGYLNGPQTSVRLRWVG